MESNESKKRVKTSIIQNVAGDLELRRQDLTDPVLNCDVTEVMN